MNEAMNLLSTYVFNFQLKNFGKILWFLEWVYQKFNKLIRTVEHTLCVEHFECESWRFPVQKKNVYF